MAERHSPQLGLVSTAHRLTTSLVPSRRAQALATLDDPTDLLLVEWSAPRDSELDDRDGWLAASPFWHARRERLIEGAWLRAQSGSASDDPDEPDPVEAFRSQWLNIWPERLVRRGTDEPLLADGAWRARRDLNATIIGTVTLALEDFFGHGAAAIVAGHTVDGRILVYGRLASNRSTAIDWLAGQAVGRPTPALVVGASLAGDPAIARIPADAVDTAGPAQLRIGLPLVRELVGAGRLVHDGGVELGEQIERARVVAAPTGLALTRGGYRADLVRALAFALASLVTKPAPPKPARWIVR